MPRLTVLGSCTIDLVFHSERLPADGEILRSAAYNMAVGGKGLCQAIAASRLGSSTTLIGQIGQDAFGDLLVEMLAREGVDRSYLFRSRSHSTGVSAMMVGEQGRFGGIIAMEAARHLDEAQVAAAESAIARSDILLLQLEVSQQANLAAAQLAAQYDVPVLLNAAPPMAVSEALLALTSLLVLNADAACALTGQDAGTMEGLVAAAREFQQQGPRIVIITLGSDGALLVHPENYALVPTHEVEAVDRAGAGDAFCAGLAVALARGDLLLEAVDYANACGALACTIAGAGPSMPASTDVDAWLDGVATLGMI